MFGKKVKCEYYDTLKALSFGGWPRARQVELLSTLHIARHVHTCIDHELVRDSLKEAHARRSGRNNMFWSCRRCSLPQLLVMDLLYSPQFNINGRRGLLYPMLSKFSTHKTNNKKSLIQNVKKSEGCFGALLHS